MTRYIAACFLDIPADWRMPIVVAFTAVQKASAVHGDTLLKGDDKRLEWERCSLARWAHGLSAVEPGKFDCDSLESSTNSSSPNLFKSRQLPVPTESIFARNDVEALRSKRPTQRLSVPKQPRKKLSMLNQTVLSFRKNSLVK